MPSNAVTRVTLTGPHTQEIDGRTFTFAAGQHFLPEHVAETARANGLVDEGETLAPAQPRTPKPAASGSGARSRRPSGKAKKTA